MANKFLMNPGPTNTRFRTKLSQWKGSDVCHRTKDFYDVLDETKQLLLNRFKSNGSFKIAIMGGSGTTAMEAMISSLINRKITVINAGIYGQRAIDMMKIYGVKYNEVKCKSIDELKSNKSYKNVYFVENETTTGEEFSVEKIAKLYPNAKLFIDSTSAFGSSDYSNILGRISSLSFCSNKCLQSTPGLGIVIWSNDLDIKPKSYYCNLKRYIGKDIPFTLPVQSVYALNKTLKISDDNKSLFRSRADRLINDLEQMGIKCINKYPSNSIIGFKHPNKSYEYLKDYLDSKNIVIYAGISEVDNSFRLSTMSVLFDKNYKKLVRSLNDSCLC
tara:strand:- start:2572 stop:3564 length:993 start_codon:yes stop_codon:yes gene_type:complete